MKKVLPILWGIMLLIGLEPLMAQGRKKFDCLECHEDVKSGKFVHEAAKKSCVACHKVVPVKNSKLPHTRETKIRVKLLCQGCHDLNVANENLHSPVKKKECTYCHNPHSSPIEYLLKEPQADLCTKCHKKVLPSTYLVRHEPATNECGKCHAVHGSDKESYMKVEIPDLCFGCHNDVEQQVNSEYVHPPAEEDCLDCHNPHSSVNPYLLTAYFPNDIYTYFTPIKFELCWQCHDESDVFGDESGFRTILGKNLHKVHVMRKKGRVCTICHSPHGSNEPKLINEYIPFGENGWAIPLKFTETKKGGKCAPACHESRLYTR